MTSAAIIQFQKKQEARFVCSACGEDRFCKCNAPALEKLAARKESDRKRARLAYEKKKSQLNQPSSHVRIYGGTGFPDDDDHSPDYDEEDVATPAEARRMGFINITEAVIEYTTHHDLSRDEIDLEMVEAAERAASAWTKLAASLRRRL